MMGLAVPGVSTRLRAELAPRAGSPVGVWMVCPGKVRSVILDRVNRRPGMDARSPCSD